MEQEAVLTRLLAQACAEGGELSTLRAIVEEAGDAGAGRAMARLGLADAGAAKDMAELRELLAAWRDAKKSALKGAIGWVVRMLLALVLIGLAAKLGFSGWVK